MEQSTEEVEKKEEHLCRETGLALTNSVDISYYMCEQNDDVLRNLLLGKFTKDGKYVIDKEYLVELVKLKKNIVEKQEDKFILSTKILDVEIKFTVTIEDCELTKKLATLRFVEFMNKLNGSKEILRTVVARYKDDADQYFIEKVYKVFNIKKADNKNDNDIDEEELFNILRRYKEMLLLKKKRIEPLDYISNIYIDEVLALLRKFPGKYSEYVLRKYSEELLKIKENFGKPGYFVKLRIMLDSILAGAIEHQKDPVLAELLLKTKSNFVENYKNVHKEILAEETKAPAAPKKQAEKPKESSSSSSGAKKKASAKKKATASKPKAKAASKKQEYYFEYKPEEKETETKQEKKETKKPVETTQEQSNIQSMIKETKQYINDLFAKVETMTEENALALNLNQNQISGEKGGAQQLKQTKDPEQVL